MTDRDRTIDNNTTGGSREQIQEDTAPESEAGRTSSSTIRRQGGSNLGAGTGSGPGTGTGGMAGGQPSRSAADRG
ncbi:hypothetical protein [Sphingomonas sp.]|uniref:hypothetical protein n=1 Tax=Sphingomonas sp. TaxID=28214 RepID=UPI0035C803DF